MPYLQLLTMSSPWQQFSVGLYQHNMAEPKQTFSAAEGMKQQHLMVRMAA